MNCLNRIKKRIKFERNACIALLALCFVMLFMSGKQVEAQNIRINQLEEVKQVYQYKIDVLEEDLEIAHYSAKWHQKENEKLREQLGVFEDLGEYTITAYCPCYECCGEYALNRPEGIVYGASGIELIEGVSVASPLPLGTEIIINGQTYINQDRTAEWIAEKYNDKIIDIYFEDHEKAIEFGKQIYEVYIKK